MERHHWMILVGFLLFSGLIFYDSFFQLDIARNRTRIDARVIRTFHMRSSGTHVEFSYEVSGKLYVDSSPCPQCAGVCATDTSCAGMRISVDYSSKHPSHTRLVDGATPRP